MDKNELLERTDTCAKEWEETIADLGPEGLERPGACGDWRVRDVIAHCNAWERWQLVQLRTAFTGETPSDEELVGGITYPDNDDMQEDAMNQMFYDGTKDLPTDEILRHFREVTRMRLDWITSASQEQIDEVVGGDWTGGTNRIFRLASEVPTVANKEQVWERLNDQIEHQYLHLLGIQEWAAAAARA